MAYTKSLVGVVNVEAQSGSAAATAIAHSGAGTVLFTNANEIGIARRALVMTYTGDQTLTVTLQVQAGKLAAAAIAAQSPISLAVPAGNVTPVAFVLTGAGLTNITGTTVLTGNAGHMNAPFTTTVLNALAGGTPTLGTLAWDFSAN